MLHQLFPIEVCQYNLSDQSLNSHILSNLKNENFLQNNEHIPFVNRSYQTNHYLHTDKKYEKLILWFKECLSDYQHNLNLDCENLDITICWANKFPKNAMGSIAKHTHRMSYLSAVYYLTPGAPTCFEDPVIQRTNNSLDVHNNRPRTACFEAQPGKLLIFPSWLEHYSMEHKAMFDRWTISFNTMPTGKINLKSNVSSNPSCDLSIK